MRTMEVRAEQDAAAKEAAKEVKEQKFEDQLPPELREWMHEAPVLNAEALLADKAVTLALEAPAGGLLPGAAAEWSPRRVLARIRS